MLFYLILFKSYLIITFSFYPLWISKLRLSNLSGCVYTCFFRDTPTLDKLRSSARLDLTSATDCVEAVDPTVVANLTRPLDFTHLVGAWLLELVSNSLTYLNAQ